MQAGPLSLAEILTLVALWSAGIYRLLITVRLPWSTWRGSFTIAMLLVPAGTTTHFFRAQVSEVLNAPNVGNLITHVLYAAAAASVAIYVDTLEQDDPRPARVRRHLVAGLVVISAIAVTWWIAPIHTQELPDLGPYSTHLAVAAYSLIFYLYLGLTIVTIVRFCWRETRAAHPRLTIKSTSLTLIGVGCATALPALTTFAAVAGVTALAPNRAEPLVSLSRLANHLAPLALGLTSLGVLSLVVLPPLAAYVAAVRRWRHLRPLWQHLVQASARGMSA